MRPARAFTLLEVVVALAVLSLGLLAVADLSGTALRSHGYARDVTAATLLARGKLAELEEKYEDQGFKDFDESEEGSFADEGYPGFQWRLEAKKPDSALGPDQLLAAVLGQAGADASTQELLASLLGTGGTGGRPAAAPGGALGSVLQVQLTAFGEALKKSLREVTLTVAWRDGRVRHEFGVTTHLVVLHPKAPAGARSAFPDVPPNLPNVPGALPLPGAGGPLPQLPPGVPQPPLMPPKTRAPAQ